MVKASRYRTTEVTNFGYPAVATIMRRRYEAMSQPEHALQGLYLVLGQVCVQYMRARHDPSGQPPLALLVACREAIEGFIEDATAGRLAPVVAEWYALEYEYHAEEQIRLVEAKAREALEQASAAAA